MDLCEPLGWGPSFPEGAAAPPVFRAQELPFHPPPPCQDIPMAPTNCFEKEPPRKRSLTTANSGVVPPRSTSHHQT